MTKPDGVKRYEFYEGSEHWDGPSMRESITGDYIAASDYDRLAGEVGRLRALLKEARVHVPYVKSFRMEGDNLWRVYEPGSLADRINQALTKGDCDE